MAEDAGNSELLWGNPRPTQPVRVSAPSQRAALLVSQIQKGYRERACFGVEVQGFGVAGMQRREWLELTSVAKFSDCRHPEL